jgi:predicted GNAT family acetyltransferase
MEAVVTKDTERERYELRVDDRVVGIADYVARGDVVVFPHTEIDPSMRGQGMGARLVRAALEDVREAGGRIVPACWYVAQFIEENPDYADLVAA